MITLEQVEKLREKANVSFEEAKVALEACDGDLLEAIIYLEKQGKVNAPAGGGYYTSQGAQPDVPEPVADGENHRHEGSFGDMMHKFGRFLMKLFRIGNTNHLVAEKNSDEIFACPITAFVLLLIFFFWVVVPLILISLFFGFRYSIRGKELGTDQVNKTMDGATDTAEDIKKNFTNDQNGKN